MSILDTVTAAFINTFGITQPTEQARRRASWFILALLLLTLVFLGLVGVGLYKAIKT